MTSLEELNEQADRVNRALTLAQPQTQTCFEKMEDIEAVLADMKSYCVMYLRANSHYNNFEVLRDLVITIRGSTLKIIKAIGDPPRDTEPIYLAADLMDALGAHIELSMNLEVLRAQHAPIGSELSYLRSSRTDITTALDKFVSSTKLLFTLLRNTNTPR